jgi:transcriptional regulator with XRE-family HTH domain
MQEQEKEQEDKFKFGNWLKAQVEARGWTIQDLANRAGVSHSTASAAINKGIVPDVGTLSRYATALRLPLRRVIEAAGYQVEDLAIADEVKRIQDLLSSHPDAWEYIAQLVRLTPEDRAAALAVVTTLGDLRGNGTDDEGGA